jgi:hypothetical protein
MSMRAAAALTCAAALLCLTACGPVARAGAGAPVEADGLLVVSGTGSGADAAEAQSRAFDAALAEAARIRSISIEAVSESLQRQRSVDGQVEEADDFTSRARTSSAAAFTGTRMIGNPLAGRDEQGRASCSVQVGVPLLQVYPGRFVAAAASAAQPVPALSALARDFEGMAMTGEAIAVWLRVARHADAAAPDRLAAAEACERLQQRVEALRLVQAELQRLADDDPLRLRAKALAERLAAAPEAAEQWRLLVGAAEAARASGRFSGEVAARTPRDATVHWRIAGSPRRVLALWSDGEDVGWLRLRGGDAPFSGLAVTNLAVPAGSGGTILAWAVPPGDAVWELLSGLPAAGIPLSAAATVEARVQLDALRAALDRAAADGCPALVLRIAP